MSIRRKLMIFATASVVVPMIILYVASTHILNKQLQDEEQRYLENSIKIARNQMLARGDEMLKGGRMLSQDTEFVEAVTARNQRQLEEEFARLRLTYDYLDFIIVLDKNKKTIASFPGNVSSHLPQELTGLVENVQHNKSPLVSEEVFELEDIFPNHSPEFNKYRIKQVDATNLSQDKFFTKCQAGLVVTPIFSVNSQSDMAGFLIVGNIANNSGYFPTAYSQSVKDSFLAISVEGVRVTSNIRTPKQENYIGSRIPIASNSREGEQYYYFGRVNIDGEVHVFLDQPIYNNQGKPIGMLGVGIPEYKFSDMLATNHNLILIITAISLFVMILFGRYFATRITHPIILATRFSNLLSKGERDITLPDWVYDSRTETSVLLRTFHKMAQDLKRSEEQQRIFMDELEQEKRQQQNLAWQLQTMNDELEIKVAARTSALQQVITALKNADVVKSQFLANMSHELRTPLNAIISSAEALQDGLFGFLNEKQTKYIQSIANSGNHLLQLINDILDISKIEAGKMKLSLSTFSVAEVIENSYLLVKSLAYRKNIQVSFTISPTDLLIKADGKKVKQILYNLLSNAVKFTPEQGHVEVAVIGRDEVMQVSIKDNGIGIREEDQERIFCEFEQVDSSYGRQYEGTGLGLPLSKKLVEMHGGHIYLSSKPGKGTEVIFTLPLDVEQYLDRSVSIAAGEEV